MRQATASACLVAGGVAMVVAMGCRDKVVSTRECVDCDGVCADLRTDVDNCGQCGAACQLPDRCIEGLCRSFWRLEPRGTNGNERTWLVNPEGQRVFLLGVNTVMQASVLNPSCDGMLDYIQRDAGGPTKAARTEWARLSDGRCGDTSVPEPLYFNSLGAWSQTNAIDATDGGSYLTRAVENGGAGASYTVVLDVFPVGSNADGGSQPDRWSLKNADGGVLKEGTDLEPVGDPFNPRFLAFLDRLVNREVRPRRDDPRLVAYYVGNELGMFDSASGKGSVRDYRAWLWSDCEESTDAGEASSIDHPLCAPHALAAFLRDRYHHDKDELNAAWGTDFAGFTQAAESRPAVHGVAACSVNCRNDLQRFVHDRLMPEWIRVITTKIRAEDPNHLVGSTRLALSSKHGYRFWSQADSPEPDIFWDDAADAGVAVPSDDGDGGVRYCPYDLFARDGASGFDFVAVNVYEGGLHFDGVVDHSTDAGTGDDNWFPNGIHKIMKESGLPVMVSEFGIRARIHGYGWSNEGGAAAFIAPVDGGNDQLERGLHYQSQIDSFISFSMIIGANWHAWADSYVAGDDSRQINKGLVQCDQPDAGFHAGAPWTDAWGPIRETNLYIMGSIQRKTGY